MQAAEAQHQERARSSPASGGQAPSAWGPRVTRTLGVIISPPVSSALHTPLHQDSRDPAGESWLGRGELLTASLTSAAQLRPGPPHTRRLWRTCPLGVKVPRLAHKGLNKWAPSWVSQPRNL